MFTEFNVLKVPVQEGCIWKITAKGPGWLAKVFKRDRAHFEVYLGSFFYSFDNTCIPMECQQIVEAIKRRFEKETGEAL